MNNIKLKELIYDLYRTKTYPEARNLILSFISIPTHVYILQVPIDYEPSKLVFTIVDDIEAERRADKLYINIADRYAWSVENMVTVEKTYFLNDKCIAKLERQEIK